MWQGESKPSAQLPWTLLLEGSGNSALDLRASVGQRWVCADRGPHTAPHVLTLPPAQTLGLLGQPQELRGAKPLVLPLLHTRGRKVSLPPSPLGPFGAP